MQNKPRAVIAELIFALCFQASGLAFGNETSPCLLFSDCSQERGFYTPFTPETSLDHAGALSTSHLLPSGEADAFIKEFIFTEGDRSRLSLLQNYARQWQKEGPKQIDERILKAILIGIDSEHIRRLIITTVFENGLFYSKLSQRSLEHLLMFFPTKDLKDAARQTILAAQGVDSATAGDN